MASFRASESGLLTTSCPRTLPLSRVQRGGLAAPTPPGHSQMCSLPSQKTERRERNTEWYRAFHPGAYGLKGKIEPGGNPIREVITFRSDHKNQQTTKDHHTFAFFALSENILPTS